MALPSSSGYYISTHWLLPFLYQDMLERMLTYHEDNMIKKKDFRIFMDFFWQNLQRVYGQHDTRCHFISHAPKQHKRYKCFPVAMLALCWTPLMEMQYIFPKDNVHSHMKSVHFCVSLISVTTVVTFLRQAPTTQVTCYYFL